jgi:DeoR family transcriptional regulator, aga operon transcriptional repressor
VRPDLKRRNGDATLTIVTNAINIAHELTGRSQFQLLVLGGVVRPAFYELIGSLAERNLAEMTLDEVILSANGLSSLSGASCNNLGEAAIGRQMIARSKHVTLVSTHRSSGFPAWPRCAGSRSTPSSATKALSRNGT